MATETAPKNETPDTRNHETTERVADMAHSAVDRAAERGARVEERLRESGDQYAEQYQNAVEQASSYVKEHPYTSLGLAAAAGFILGSLFRR